MARKAFVYDEKAIKTPDPLASVRGCTSAGWGNGSNPNDGISVPFQEEVDNAIDEFIMGKSRRVEITRDGDEVTVRDYGRGTPLGKVVDCGSKMYTGGKYDDVFKFSVGLNEVGTKAVNTAEIDGGRFHKVATSPASR